MDLTNSDEVRVGELKTGDTTWTVNFNKQNHLLTGRAERLPEVIATTWEQLEGNAKVRASQAKTKVKIPYAYIGYDGPPYGEKHPVIKRGTATGVHASDTKILAREDGGPVQLPLYGNRDRFTPPTEEDGREMIRLTAEIRDLEAQLANLTTKYVFPEGDLGRQVQHEIEQARKAEDHG